jgi:hypothetical protein
VFALLKEIAKSYDIMPVSLMLFGYLVASLLYIVWIQRRYGKSFRTWRYYKALGASSAEEREPPTPGFPQS